MGMETELERREARLAAARRKLAELTTRPAEPGFLAEIEQVHEQVEAIERRLRAAKIPALAVRLRHQLVAARAAEQGALAAHGFDSWLGFQLRRVEHLLYQPSADELEAAEVEHRRALAAWREFAQAMEAEEAAAAEEPEVARRPSTIAPWPIGWSALPT